LARWP